jgi:hypothetical protein
VIHAVERNVLLIGLEKPLVEILRIHNHNPNRSNKNFGCAGRQMLNFDWLDGLRLESDTELPIQE